MNLTEFYQGRIPLWDAYRGYGTPASTPFEGLVSSTVAAPNVSRNGNPVHLRFTLGHQPNVRLSFYALAGEQVFQETVAGNWGANDLTWQVENQAHQAVATGLYFAVVDLTNSQGGIAGHQVTQIVIQR